MDIIIIIIISFISIRKTFKGHIYKNRSNYIIISIYTELYYNLKAFLK